MYNWDNYDNDMAYSYDEYVESNEDDTQEQEEFDFLQYESKMAEQLIDSLYQKDNI